MQTVRLSGTLGIHEEYFEVVAETIQNFVQRSHFSPPAVLNFSIALKHFLDVIPYFFSIIP
ncbi:hypothetical protein H1P_6400006 [Hyella patelloides LEGE 07179]|uniref:Uncharacterized protein n=1 Tax=Hyella patelloides LEGE 07179 TaxID=945734 RepID=A0A563W296_9CYAN|nr:hypothetical protein [Hyella patelloides]VEP17765.1 hypothetical protein H1P_6400006 [Hyella patelloides LEGE 07179]